MPLQKNKTILIFHGTKGSPEGNWFPWLKSLAESRGYNVYVPRFPTPENQSVDAWFNALSYQAPAIDTNTILIGHSIGATFLMNVLERLSTPVYKSIFVSPVLDLLGLEEYDTLNRSFIKTPDYDWDSMSANAGDRYILHGDNDPYVPQTHAEFLQDQIGGELFIIPNGGHLNAEFNYTKFEMLWDLIEKIPQPDIE